MRDRYIVFALLLAVVALAFSGLVMLERSQPMTIEQEVGQ